nr:type II toxin-antitoxin system HicB family antitoxin [Candidatus Sigynarchaeum springense]MDO8117136.1 type II toxin-antitoxin system HicB family antitoxin [Candidatus Sigynarchaeota archaeon]
MGEYTVIIKRDEAGYLFATVAELPGCHTQAKTKEELMSRIKEAIELYLEVTSAEAGRKVYEHPSFVSIEKVVVP